MPAWLQRDWCSSFVLTLGHFLWQGTLIAVVLAIALRAVKTVSVRYWLSLAALLLMAACPMTTLGWLVRPVSHVAMFDTQPVVREEAEPIPQVAAEAHVANATPFPDELPQAEPIDLRPREPVAMPVPQSTPVDERSWWQRFAPQLTTTYLCGVGLMLLRLAIGLWGGRRLRRRTKPVTDNSLLSALQRQADALGMKLRPVLAYCERVTVPTVVGVLKPMILLPITLASGLSPEQIESVLAHELAHLRRCDHLVNLLQRVIESLLFFHPAVWWVSHRVREEREHCCDDLVVACGAMPLDYAKSLLRVAELSRTSKLRRSIAAVSLLATGDKPSNLRQRIARLLGESATPSLRISPRVLMLAISIPLVALIVTIQSGVSNHQPASSPNATEEQVAEEAAWDELDAMNLTVYGGAFQQRELVRQLRHLEKAKFPEKGLQEIRQQLQLPIRDAEFWIVPAKAWPQVGRLLSLRKLGIVASDLRGKPMDEIGHLRDLRRFVVATSKFQPADLEPLRQLTQLEHLEVTFTVFDETQAQRREQLGDLSEAEQDLVKRVEAVGSDREHLWQAAILTDRALEQLADLKHLRTVKLINTIMSSRGVRMLSKLPALEELELGVVDESSEVVRLVGAIKSLKRLTGLSLTDDVLGEWTALAQLEELGRYAGGVTDQGVDHLLKMTQLRRLVLWHSQLSDAGLERLAALPHLESLDVRFSKSLSQAGVERFQQRNPQCKIAFEQPTDTNAAEQSALPLKPQHYIANLPDGHSIEFVGITKNTAPAKEGWRPDGQRMGDVPDFKVHLGGPILGGTFSGATPPEDVNARDFLFEFQGLRNQPSMNFQLPFGMPIYSQDPIQDSQLRLRVLAHLNDKEHPFPDAASKPRPHPLRVGLTDEPWGTWQQFSATGQLLNQLGENDLHRSSYSQIQFQRVGPSQHRPNRTALVFRQPKQHFQQCAFEMRGFDTDGQEVRSLYWRSQLVAGTDLEEFEWFPNPPLTEGQQLARFEYRLRPYRHWVTFENVSLVPGQQTDVKVKVESQPAQEANKPALRITGRVLDAETGKPIAKCRMVPTNVYRDDSKQITWQTQYLKEFTDERFVYETDRPWDKTKLRIEADGYQPATTRAVSKGEVVELDVKLVRKILAGVVRLPNGQPAAKAQLALASWTNEISVAANKLSYSGHGAKLRTVVETDEQGRFVMPAEVDPCVVVVAHEAGYAEVANAERSLARKSPVGQDEAEDKPNEEGKPKEDTAVIELQPWGRVEGRVLIGDKPVVGAKYWVYQSRADDAHVRTNTNVETDADGRFVVEQLPPGRHGICQRYADGSDGKSSHFISGLLVRFDIPAGKKTTLELGGRGRALIGKLALPEGFPHKVDWSKVSLRVSLQAPRLGRSFGQIGGDNEQAQSWSNFLQTDEGKLYGRTNVAIAADGSFRIEGLPAAEYDLAVNA
ncbi:MAG: M48 family metalloprotease, partial [Planctomycetaceae bacterium]|nr:M48 family metalloprotease [Planctomycetaceae bacterium]